MPIHLMLALFACAGVDDAALPVDSATLDADGDGAVAVVDGGDDCDDADASVFPSADELCDGRDDDCDGSVDEDATDATSWALDADGDGYGGADIVACERPEGTAEEGGDCDDADADVFPGAIEVCDAVDQDCDGAVDDDALDATAWYTDADGDGFGDDASVVTGCDAPDGAAAVGGDCDDADADVSPEAVERCDGTDHDCDGEVEEAESVDASTLYPDTDGDGYGDPLAGATACAFPAIYVEDATDCDDARSAVHPGAEETCETTDEDCDGDVDEDAADAATWYADVDADGYGDPGSTSAACDAPIGTVADDTDCDDADAATHPAADERCDGDDQDCDGEVDEAGAIDAITMYPDADGDGYGDASGGVTACAFPASYVPDDTDCDDADPDVHPDADETCDATDEDCDGEVDEDAIDVTAWYTDADADGFGDPASTIDACDAPVGTVADATDCDDARAEVFPGAPEQCDGQADDCDATAWTDADEDGTAARLDVSGAFVEDLTSSLALGAYALPADGTVSLCRGAWTVAFTGAESAATVEGRYGAAETVLDAGGAAVFALEGGSVALSGLTITGSVTTGSGGAVTLTGGTGATSLTVEACVLTGNSGEWGSALFVDGASATLTGSEVYANTGPALGATAGTIALVDSSVYANTDDAATGAGARIQDGALSCTSSTGAHGFWTNIGHGVVLAGAGSVDSVGCTWGSDASDNAPDDLWLEDAGSAWSWEGVATFTCDETGCL